MTEYLDMQLNDRALEAVLVVGYEQFKVALPWYCAEKTILNCVLFRYSF